MTDQPIVWEDPPTSVAGPAAKGVWAQRLAPLREHPGVWANLGDFHQSQAFVIRHGRKSGVPAGEFETCVRNVKNGRGTLYARFVGGGAA